MSVLETTVKKIYPQDSEARDLAKKRLESLTMPHWALGDLMDLAIDIAGIMRVGRPQLGKKVITVMAADHGVAAEGVSKYPAEVTIQMAANIMRGGAGINALASQSKTDVVIVDMGINADYKELAKVGNIINKKIGLGTGNMAVGPAMSRTMAQKSIENGIAVAEDLAGEYDVFGTGELGIGNTTPATAIAAVLTGKSVAEVCGPGSGLNDEQLKHKITVVEKALAVNSPDPKDGIDILAKVGGFEIGGLAGMILGAASRHKPVVIDGFISTSAAMIAATIEPFVKDYMIFSHKSMEPGHRAMYEYLGAKKALLDLNFRLGEGTGAAVAMNLLEGAMAIMNQMATFDEAAVSGADK